MGKVAETMSSELRIIRFPEVKKRVGFCAFHLRRLEAKGEFPKRVRIGANSVGWVEAEITAWLSAKVAQREGASDVAA